MMQKNDDAEGGFSAIQVISSLNRLLVYEESFRFFTGSGTNDFVWRVSAVVEK